MMPSSTRILAPSRELDAASSPSFLELPAELRHRIYGYALLAEKSWIGAISALDGDTSHDKKAEDLTDIAPPMEEDDARHGLQTTNHHRPRAFIHTTASLSKTCHQIRNEYREAIWWQYMHELKPDSYIDVQAHDFQTNHIRHFFNCCSDSELLKLNERRPGPKHNTMRIHFDVLRVYPSCAFLEDQPRLFIASVVLIGYSLALLLDRLQPEGKTPRLLIELREIARLAASHRDITDALRDVAGSTIQEPVGRWMAFVQWSGLRAKYVTDEPMHMDRKMVWHQAMADRRCFARDELWESLYDCVMQNDIRRVRVVKKVCGVFLLSLLRELGLVLMLFFFGLTTRQWIKQWGWPLCFAKCGCHFFLWWYGSLKLQFIVSPALVIAWFWALFR